MVATSSVIMMGVNYYNACLNTVVTDVIVLVN